MYPATSWRRFTSGAIAAAIASALAGDAMSKLIGGGQNAASGGIQGDVFATDNYTGGVGSAWINSVDHGCLLSRIVPVSSALQQGKLIPARETRETGQGSLFLTVQSRHKSSCLVACCSQRHGILRWSSLPDLAPRVAPAFPGRCDPRNKSLAARHPRLLQYLKRRTHDRINPGTTARIVSRRANGIGSLDKLSVCTAP